MLVTFPECKKKPLGCKFCAGAKYDHKKGKGNYRYCQWVFVDQHTHMLKCRPEKRGASRCMSKNTKKRPMSMRGAYLVLKIPRTEKVFLKFNGMHKVQMWTSFVPELNVACKVDMSAIRSAYPQMEPLKLDKKLLRSKLGEYGKVILDRIKDFQKDGIFTHGAKTLPPLVKYQWQAKNYPL